MEQKTILEYILGDITVNFLLAFYAFSLLGVLLSMLLHYKKKEVKAKRVSEKPPFDWKFWLKDNTVRVLTSIICIFVLVRFYDELPIDYELNMFLGILVGVSLDQVIIFIRNKTSISIFQTKS